VRAGAFRRHREGSEGITAAAGLLVVLRAMAAMQAAWRVQVYARLPGLAMDRWFTDLIDRYFISEPTPNSLRAIMLLAAFLQAASAAAGFVMLWHAIGCGLSQHHGHSILCTLGVVIAIASFEIATITWKRARTAREGSSASG